MGKKELNNILPNGNPIELVLEDGQLTVTIDWENKCDGGTDEIEVPFEFFLGLLKRLEEKKDEKEEPSQSPSFNAINTV